VFGIFLPLAFHALYGVKLALEGKPNAVSYVHARNWLYVLQRVTGVLTLLFLCAHLWEFRVQKWLFGMDTHAFYDTLQAHLSATSWGLPLYALAYAVGLGSAVFHFGNGLVGFCLSWGLIVSRRAQRFVAIFATALSIGLFLLGFSTIVFFSTGTRLLPTGQSAQEAPCPEPK
jgi:succinate dehydrogenase/fumarate reductase cytochrome b subunit (b558 family)